MSNNLHTLFPFLHTREALLQEIHMHKHLLSQFESWQKEQQQEFMWLQYLWSLLLTGDKTQLITGKTFKNIQGLSERFTLNEEFHEFLKSYMDQHDEQHQMYSYKESFST